MKNLIILIFAAVLFTGCQSVEKNAYRTIGAIATTTDATMLGWGDYVRAGLPKPGEEAKVKDAYLKYQATMLVAKTAVLTYVDNKDNQSKLQATLNVVAASSSALIELVKIYMQGGK